MPYSIAIAHSKGGTGKTTTATQLVDALNINRIADIDIHIGRPEYSPVTFWLPYQSEI